LIDFRVKLFQEAALLCFQTMALIAAHPKGIASEFRAALVFLAMTVTAYFLIISE
jgi:hypothetical protein